MTEPQWLTKSILVAVHEKLLSEFGGLGGLRENSLLESALHRPLQTFTYSQPTIFELAAIYATGIIKNHPFIDGNKRSGFMAAYVFLEANGLRFDATNADVIRHTLLLAAGDISETQYAAWLEKNCVKPQA